MLRMTRSLTAGLVLMLPSLVPGQEARTVDKKPARPSIYDAKADTRSRIATATAQAGREAKRVLVMFGGDWCGWCHKLHGLFQSDPAIREVLDDRYVVVMVDTQAPGAEALLDECKGDLDGVGYPFLAVLDAKGNVVTRQKTDPLEVGDHHDPAKVKQLLETWAPPRETASKLMQDALARASSEDKLVFLHFGTPTCGWCRHLEAFLARDDMAAIFGLDFVDAKLDLVQTPGADEFMRKYNTEQTAGVPWFVFLDAKGKALVNCDGPEGNIGYPYEPKEVEHFLHMLNKVKRKIEPAQVEAIEQALKAQRRKIEEAQAAAAKQRKQGAQ